MSDPTHPSAPAAPAPAPAPACLAAPLPRLVITPSSPCFPDDLFVRPPPYSFTHDILENTPTSARPPISRSLSYDLDLSSHPIPTSKEKRPRSSSSSSSSLPSYSRSKRSSSSPSWPSPHLLAPPAPLPLPKSGHRPLRNPFISMLFLLLGLVLVLSSAMCGSDTTAQLLTFKDGRLGRISEAGRLLRWRLAVVMDLRNEQLCIHSTDVAESTMTTSTKTGGAVRPASASASASAVPFAPTTRNDVPCPDASKATGKDKRKGKGMMSTEEWKAYLRSASAHRQSGTHREKESWAGPASTIGDLWDFH